MKTITFYSYKGGVGRTLALVNIANRLTEFGKKVCVMDFDLEAPGLNHKYRHSAGKIEHGLVDYIYEFAVNGNLPDSIGQYAKEITKYKYTNEKDLNKRRNDIIFISAGNSDQGEYWKKLSHISWWDLFYKENSEGIPFFLDLKEKIKKEFNPDYLLIDTRTGITETSAIIMSVLADSIVLLAVNNDENICGTQRIIESLTRKENNLLGASKEIHFVLTRLPQITSPEEWTIDEAIKNRVKRTIEETFQHTDVTLNSFNVIHSNKDIALYDRVTMNYDFDERKEKDKKDSTPSISLEYLSLFDSLTENDLSKEEKEKFDTLKRAGELLQQVYDNFDEKDTDLLEQLDKIEKLVPQMSDVNFLRGRYYFEKSDYLQAIQYFNKEIEIGDTSGKSLCFRAITYLLCKKYEEALVDLDKYISRDCKEYRLLVLENRIIAREQLGIERTTLISECQKLIEEYPNYARFYNSISYLYYREQEYESALKNIYKAIELDPSSIYFCTLAEINFCKGNMLEFYRNFDEALNKGLNVEELLDDVEHVKNIYKQAIKDPEFVRILNKHNKAYFVELIQKDATK